MNNAPSLSLSPYRGGRVWATLVDGFDADGVKIPLSTATNGSNVPPGNA